MAKRRVLIFENSFALSNYLLEKWAALAAAAVQQQGRFTVALSGGKTPIEFYCRLSNFDRFDLWTKTHLFLTDERFVSIHSPESNFRLIKNNLLDYLQIPDENIHPVLLGPVDSIDEAAAQYEGHLETFFSLPIGQRPRFDLVLLGVGEDGHTASLFPEDVNLNETSRSVTVGIPPTKKPPRISLTLPVINNAACVIFLVTGRNKASVIADIFIKGADLPAGRVLPQNGEIIFLLDRDAAQQLPLPEELNLSGDALAWEPPPVNH